MIEMCEGCGRPVLVHRIANLVVKCEPTPLTDVGEIVRMLTSPNPPSLWMVERNQQGQPTRLRGARPGEPGPVPEHRCLKAQEALSRPRTPSPVSQPQSTPPEPPAGRTTRSSGPSAAPSRARVTASPSHERSVRSAVTQGSDGPRCDECGIIMKEGEYVSVQLGEIYMWAQHLTNCGG